MPEGKYTVQFMKSLNAALKLKQLMLEKGVTSGRKKCTQCDGMTHGRLIGPKKHMRFWCDGPCKAELME